MLIKRTFNNKIVDSVLTDPIIWEAISSPGMNTASLSSIHKRGNINVVGYVDDTLIGLGILHTDIRKDWYCHFHVFKENRKEFAIPFAKESLEWVWENTKINIINASIPLEHPNVKLFSSVMNFTQHKCIDGRWLMKLRRPGK